MEYITETYTTEGWVQDEPRTMSGRECAAVLEILSRTGRLDWIAVRAVAEEVLGLSADGGPYRGQCKIRSMDNWRWFLGHVSKM